MSYRQIFGGVTNGLKNLLLLFRDNVAITFVECLFSTLWDIVKIFLVVLEQLAWFLLLTPLTFPKSRNFLHLMFFNLTGCIAKARNCFSFANYEMQDFVNFVAHFNNVNKLLNLARSIYSNGGTSTFQIPAKTK